jgi:hypothetical protein
VYEPGLRSPEHVYIGADTDDNGASDTDAGDDDEA